MNFKQKLAYMLIGCLFTIAGYIIASLGGGDTTHAQQDEQVLGKIVCRQLEVVNIEGTPVARIYADENGGVIDVRNAAGKQSVVNVACKDGKGTGNISVFNTVGKRVVSVDADFFGNGSIEVRNAAGKLGANIYATDFVGTQMGGGISVYNAAEKSVVGIWADKDGNGTIETLKGNEVGEPPKFKNP